MEFGHFLTRTFTQSYSYFSYKLSISRIRFCHSVFVFSPTCFAYFLRRFVSNSILLVPLCCVLVTLHSVLVSIGLTSTDFLHECILLRRVANEANYVAKYDVKYLLAQVRVRFIQHELALPEPQARFTITTLETHSSLHPFACRAYCSGLSILSIAASLIYAILCYL